MEAAMHMQTTADEHLSIRGELRFAPDFAEQVLLRVYIKRRRARHRPAAGALFACLILALTPHVIHRWAPDSRAIAQAELASNDWFGPDEVTLLWAEDSDVGDLGAYFFPDATSATLLSD
jgi:hypothetical protein